MAEHVRECRHLLCSCEGVPFERGLGSHRKGTRGCEHHPMGGLHRAERHGASDSELVQIEKRLRAELPGPDVPF